MAKVASVWGDLDGLSGEVDYEFNPFDHTLNCSSPSMNWIFANSWGLPAGLAVAFIGKPKSGKTLLVNDYIAHLHATDPEALAVKFDSEFRASSQGRTALTSRIDKSRLKEWSVNSPKDVFDRIEHDIAAFQQKNNNKIKLIVIDSLNGIFGRRTENADSIEQMQIGDAAATLGEGFKRILGVIRKYNIALIVTAHVRAEMDRTEIMRGNILRAAIPFAVKHSIEYFVFVEADETKDGKLIEEDSVEKGKAVGKNIVLGHKIYARMIDSSNGPKGRVAKFTLKYDTGIANLGEEVAELGVSLGVIERPNNQSYKFEDLVWRGRQNLVDSLEENPTLRQKVLDIIRAEDLKNVL